MVRELLMRLEQDGLVIRRNKIGTYVREIGDEEVLDIFDIRIGIEPIIAAAAASVGYTPFHFLFLFRDKYMGAKDQVRCPENEAKMNVNYSLSDGGENYSVNVHFFGNISYIRGVWNTGADNTASPHLNHKISSDPDPSNVVLTTGTATRRTPPNPLRRNLPGPL